MAGSRVNCISSAFNLEYPRLIESLTHYAVMHRPASFLSDRFLSTVSLVHGEYAARNVPQLSIVLHSKVIGVNG